MQSYPASLSVAAPQAASAAETAAAAYMRRHWATIAFVTTANAPWNDPKRLQKRDIAAYCQRIVAALLDSRNHEHDKFMLLVRKYRLSADIVSQEFREGGKLSDLLKYEADAGSKNDRFASLAAPPQAATYNVPAYLRPVKLSMWKGTLQTAVVTSRAFGELRHAYTQFLNAASHLGNYRSYMYVDARREQDLLKALLEGVPLTEQRAARRRPTTKEAAEVLSEDDDAAVEGDDVDPITSQAASVSTTASSLPGPVVHRWSATAYLPALIPQQTMGVVGCLGALIRRTFLLVLPQGKATSVSVDGAPPGTGCGAFAVNPHLKMMQHHVTWLAPQAGAPVQDTPFTTLREQTKLHAVANVASFKSVVDAKQQALLADRTFAAYTALLNLMECGELGEIERSIKQFDIESGRRKQQEGAVNEQFVWTSHTKQLVDQVALPLHLEVLSDKVRYPRTPASVEFINEKYPNPLQWIEKCLGMILDEDEEAMVCAHPAFDGAAFAAEERYWASKPSEESNKTTWLERKRYFMFKLFAQYCANLPFYHFIDESALTLAERRLPGANATAAALELGYQWVNVGELDGMLVDLCSNDVLSCFEIKANPADIGKAVHQGVRFSAMLDPAFAKTLLRDAVVGGKGAADMVELEGPSVPSDVKIEPRYSPYSRPYYDCVFPLFSDHFRKHFANPVERRKRWFIVTNIPVMNIQGTKYEAQPNLPLPCEAPMFVVPAQGRARHVIVEAMALLFVQSNNAVSAASAGSPTGSQAVRIDEYSAASAAAKINGRLYGKKMAEPRPVDVLTTLQNTSCCANIVWLERRPEDLQSSS